MSSEDYLQSLLNKQSEGNLDEVKNMRLVNKQWPFLYFSDDRLTVQFVNRGLQYQDRASVQADKPAKKEYLVYYYEIHVVDCDEKDLTIHVGFGEEDFPKHKYPGFSNKKNSSFCYRQDGKLFREKVQVGREVGRFKKNDVVGCGINFIKRNIFFTVNGVLRDQTIDDIEIKNYYATVGMHNPKEKLSFNFGKAPFMFNLEQFVQSQRKLELQEILDQNVNSFTLHQIVHQYLYFQGYFDTLEVFQKSSEMQNEKNFLIRNQSMEIEPNTEAAEKAECSQGPNPKRTEVPAKSLEETKCDDNEESHSRSLKIQEESQQSQKQVLEYPDPNQIMKKNSLTDQPLELSNQKSDALDLFDVQLNREMSMNFEFTHKKPLNQQELEYIQHLNNQKSTNFENLNEALNGSRNDPGSLVSGENTDNGKESLDEKIQEENPSNQDKSEHTQDQSQEILFGFRRSVLQLIKRGEIEQFLTVFEKQFPGLIDKEEELKTMLYFQIFFEKIKQNDSLGAIIFAQQHNKLLLNKQIWTLDDSGHEIQISWEKASGVLSYQNPEKSSLKNLVDQTQRDLIADIVNRTILKQLNYSDRSVLETLLAQTILIQDKFKENDINIGHIFNFHV